MGTVTDVMVTGMVGMPIMMGMVGTTIMVMAITGMIGLTAGAMGIATGMMIAVLGLLTVGVTGPGWYPGYGAYAAPRYDYPPNQCFDPRYGWYPCPYYNYGY